MAGGLQLPDVVGAIIDYLRRDADVLSYVNQRVPAGRPPRIASSFPESSDKRMRWEMPDYAVLVGATGGPPPDIDLGIQFTRIDVRCYGYGRTLGIRRRTANELWRTVHPALVPPPYNPSSFHSKGVIVQQIYPEGDGFPDLQPGTAWPFYICSYVVAYMSQRVAA